MLKSTLWDYSDAHIIVNVTITITGEENEVAAGKADEQNKGVIFKNCAPFIYCISEINKPKQIMQRILML